MTHVVASDAALARPGEDGLGVGVGLQAVVEVAAGVRLDADRVFVVQ